MSRETVAERLAKFPSLEDALSRCPNRADHTPGRPTGYFEFHAWAEEKSKTHRQVRCSGCGRFLIWIPKLKGGKA